MEDALREFLEKNGPEHPFYGVDFNRFKLGNAVFEAIEDPCDDYRSCLGCIKRNDNDGIFFDKSIAMVRVMERRNGDFEGYELVDAVDGHVWLRVGTDTYDEYYPTFVFSYTPNVHRILNHLVPAPATGYGDSLQ